MQKAINSATRVQADGDVNLRGRLVKQSSYYFVPRCVCHKRKTHRNDNTSFWERDNVAVVRTAPLSGPNLNPFLALLNFRVYPHVDTGVWRFWYQQFSKHVFMINTFVQNVVAVLLPQSSSQIHIHVRFYSCSTKDSFLQNT